METKRIITSVAALSVSLILLMGLSACSSSNQAGKAATSLRSDVKRPVSPPSKCKYCGGEVKRISGPQAIPPIICNKEECRIKRMKNTKRRICG